jgi:hypothetical protein
MGWICVRGQTWVGVLVAILGFLERNLKIWVKVRCVSLSVVWVEP